MTYFQFQNGYVTPYRPYYTSLNLLAPYFCFSSHFTSKAFNNLCTFLSFEQNDLKHTVRAWEFRSLRYTFDGLSNLRSKSKRRLRYIRRIFIDIFVFLAFKNPNEPNFMVLGPNWKLWKMTYKPLSLQVKKIVSPYFWRFKILCRPCTVLRMIFHFMFLTNDKSFIPKLKANGQILKFPQKLTWR